MPLHSMSPRRCGLDAPFAPPIAARRLTSFVRIRRTTATSTSAATSGLTSRARDRSRQKQTNSFVVTQPSGRSSCRMLSGTKRPEETDVKSKSRVEEESEAEPVEISKEELERQSPLMKVRLAIRPDPI